MKARIGGKGRNLGTIISNRDGGRLKRMLRRSEHGSNRPQFRRRHNVRGSNFVIMPLIINGGGSIIEANTMLDVGPFNYAGVIKELTLLGTKPVGENGSIVIDVWKKVAVPPAKGYDTFPPTVADTMCGTYKPTITTAVKAQYLDLITTTPPETATPWPVTAFTIGDIIRFNVVSCSVFEQVTLCLGIART